MRRAPFVGYKIPAPASAHCDPRRRIAQCNLSVADTLQRVLSLSASGAGLETRRYPCTRPFRSTLSLLGRNSDARQGAISPKQGRCSETGAQRPGLGGTPVFQPEKWAIPAQRPGSGEIGPRKIPPWESWRERPARLPAGTPRTSPARSSEFLPSRDVAQKSGRFPAPTAKFLPSRDVDPAYPRIVLALEKRRHPSGAASPKQGRWSLRLRAKDWSAGRDKTRRRRRDGSDSKGQLGNEATGKAEPLLPGLCELAAGAENYLKW